MRIPSVVGEGGRYQIDQEVGRGGMGVVYRARDRNTGQHVAVKVILDSSNPDVLSLFDKECHILAELQHTNIIGMTDRGEFQDGTSTYPYFVMPFLRGRTLHEWAAARSDPPTVAEVAIIVSAAAAGLQAAHNRGVIHRDIKPSNIFVLDSGSVVVIDFGIVHLGDNRTLTSLKGTPAYMAPELLDSRKNEKPSAQSDLFSLGVVCYEALTGAQPFMRPTARETTHAILHEIPRPAYELNRNISLAVSQVVQKAIAKNKNHRYKTVVEFAEKFQRASRNEFMPEFDRNAIEDRLRIVRDALAKGQATSAHEMLRGIEEEGYVDPSITAQREKIDQALQQIWIRTQLESARLYREAKDYLVAIEKINEVLKAVPEEPEALAERDLINQERLTNALGEARQHMEKHEFVEARKAIDEARQMDPRDTQTSELQTELTRMEEHDRNLAEHKEILYQNAQKAKREGYLTTAVQRLEALIELIRGSGLMHPSDRDAIYIRFHEEVLQEQSRIQKAFEEAKQYLDSDKLSEAAKVCDNILVTNPRHPLFQALKLQAENRSRELRFEYVKGVCARLHDTDDLETRMLLVQEAVVKHPGESQLSELLRNIKGRRDLVLSLITEARKAEEAGEFMEALGRWQIIRDFHPTAPGLRQEMARLEKRLEEHVSTTQKHTFTEEISRLLAIGDYKQALSVCAAALEVFPGDGELLGLHRDAQARLDHDGQLKTLLAEGRQLLREGWIDPALDRLRDAFDLGPNTARQLLGVALLDKAHVVLESNYEAADQLLQEARELIPDDPAVRSFESVVADRRQRDRVEACLVSARQSALAGDLRGAILAIDECLKLYPNDQQLLTERWKLAQELDQPLMVPLSPPEEPLPGERDPSYHSADAPTTEPEELGKASPVGLVSVVPAYWTGSQVTEETPQRDSAAALRSLMAWLQAHWRIPPQVSAARVRSWNWLQAGWVGAKARVQRVDWKTESLRIARNRSFLGIGAAVIIVIISLIGYRVISKRHRQVPPRPPVVTEVQITAMPGAQILIDDKIRAEAGGSVKLDPGRHTVSASLRGYQTYHDNFDVTAGPKTLTVNLEPLPLHLRVQTNQPRVSVSLDNQAIGDASGGDVSANIPPGTHTVRVAGPSEYSIPFEYHPERWPETVTLPASRQAAVLFFGTFEGKARAQCYWPVKMTIDDQERTIDVSGNEFPLADGTYQAQLSVASGPSVKIIAGGSPELTIDVFWGEKPPRQTIDVKAMLSQAEKLIERQQFEKADGLVKQVLEADPSNERAQELRRTLEQKDVIYHWKKK